MISDRVAAVTAKRVVERGQTFVAVDEVVPEDVVAERVDVRVPELDRLGRLAAFEIVGDDVGELEQRNPFVRGRLVAVVLGVGFGGSTDRVDEPSRSVRVEREWGGAEQQDDLHGGDGIGAAG